MTPTKEDIESLIACVETQKEIPHGLFSDEGADELVAKLRKLLALYDKSGLPLKEVDIYLLGEVPGRKQKIQVHAFAVGDKYKLLPEDEDPDIPEDGWEINDIRAHVAYR